jgi:hypothetical protein
MINRKTIWVAGVILFGSFLLGFVAGGASMMLVSKTRPHALQSPPPKTLSERPKTEPRRRPMETVLLKRMQHVLELNEAQSFEISKELQQVSESFDLLHRSTWEEMKRILEGADQAIKGQLDERQAALYEAHFSRKRLREGLGRPPFRDERRPEGGLRGPRDNERRRGMFPPDPFPGSESVPPPEGST